MAAHYPHHFYHVHFWLILSRDIWLYPKLYSHALHCLTHLLFCVAPSNIAPGLPHVDFTT